MRKTLRAKASKTKKKAGLICTAVLLGCAALGYNMYTNATSNALPFLESGKEITTASNVVKLNSVSEYDFLSQGEGPFLKLDSNGYTTYAHIIDANTVGLIKYNKKFEAIEKKSIAIPGEEIPVSEKGAGIAGFHDCGDGGYIFAFITKYHLFFYNTTTKKTRSEFGDHNGDLVFSSEGDAYYSTGSSLKHYDSKADVLETKNVPNGEYIYGVALWKNKLYSLVEKTEGTLVLRQHNADINGPAVEIPIIDYNSEASAMNDGDRTPDIRFYSYGERLHIVSEGTRELDHFAFMQDASGKLVLTDSETFDVGPTDEVGVDLCDYEYASPIDDENLLVSYHCDGESDDLVRLVNFGDEPRAYARRMEPARDKRGKLTTFIRVLNLDDKGNNVLMRAEISDSPNSLDAKAQLKFYPVGLGSNPSDGPGLKNGGNDSGKMEHFPLRADPDVFNVNPSSDKDFKAQAINGHIFALNYFGSRSVKPGNDFLKAGRLFSKKDNTAYALLEQSDLDKLVFQNPKWQNVIDRTQYDLARPIGDGSEGSLILEDGMVIAPLTYVNITDGGSHVGLLVSYELSTENPQGKILSVLKQTGDYIIPSFNQDPIVEGDILYDLYSPMRNYAIDKLIVASSVNLKTGEVKLIASCEEMRDSPYCHDSYIYTMINDGDNLVITNGKEEFSFSKREKNQRFSLSSLREYPHKDPASTTTSPYIDVKRDEKGINLLYSPDVRGGGYCMQRIAKGRDGLRDVESLRCMRDSQLDGVSFNSSTGGAIIDDNRSVVSYQSFKVDHYTDEQLYSQVGIVMIDWASKTSKSISLADDFLTGDPSISYASIGRTANGINLVRSHERSNNLDTDTYQVREMNFKNLEDVKLPEKNGRSYLYADEIVSPYPPRRQRRVRVLPTAQPEPIVPKPEEKPEIKPESKPEAGQDSKPWPKPAEKPGKKPGANKDKIENPKTADDLPMLLGGLATLGGAIFIVFKKLSNRR